MAEVRHAASTRLCQHIDRHGPLGRIGAFVFLEQTETKRSDSPFPTGIILVSLFILAFLYFLYPMYATRSATVEYDAYETEKAEFLRQNPSLRMQDYLRYKIEEANTRHFGSLAGSQSLMAGAMVADILSGLFAGAGRAGGRR